MAITLRRKALALVCWILVLSLLLTGCSKKTPEEPVEESSGEEENVEQGEYPVQIGEFEIAVRPQRVVSLANSITEKIYDLGLEDRLVGVSSYCDYPAAARDLPRAGTSQLPEVNVIQDLGATTVLASAPLSGLETNFLAQRDIQVIVLPGGDSLAHVWQQYQDIAILMEGSETGAALAEKVTAPAKDWLQQTAENIQAQAGEEILSLYLKKLEFVVATGDSVEQELMDLLGLTNIAQDKTGWYYPEAEAKEGQGLEKFQQLAMILMDEDDVSISMLEQNEFYKGLSATIHDRYLYIDSSAIERQGFSMLTEVQRMAQELWPEASLPQWEASSAGEELVDSTTHDSEDLEEEQEAKETPDTEEATDAVDDSL